MKRAYFIIIFGLYQSGCLHATNDYAKKIKKIYDNAYLISSVYPDRVAKADPLLLLGNVLHHTQKTQNFNEAIGWYQRFQKRVALDERWLNEEQRKVLAVLEADLHKKITKIKPNSKSMLLPSYKQEAQHWLRTVVQENQCGGLDWRSHLGQNPRGNVNVHPTSKQLREYRLALLSAGHSKL